MLIHFLCLCPLRLAIMLNFNILKVAYLSSLSTEREKILTSGCPSYGQRKDTGFGRMDSCASKIYMPRSFIRLDKTDISL